MLNSIEDAHLKNMGTFETDEHLQARTPLMSAFTCKADANAGDPDVRLMTQIGPAVSRADIVLAARSSD